MDERFPESADAVHATLCHALELKGFEREARIVEQARLSVQSTEYDGWNGGTYLFTIFLQVSLEEFVSIEPKLEAIETSILRTSQSLWRAYDNHQITAVSIYPEPVSPGGAAGIAVPAQMPGFWTPNQLRLFISHCSAEKIAVASLRETLGGFGISGFVAHEDIEPSQQWEREIERALQTAEALLAVISGDFRSSRWCDQEVGFALGRGIPVIPVRFGADPHGFVAKIQALSVPDGDLSRIAVPLTRLLLNSPRTVARTTSAIVTAVAEAHSYAAAKQAVSALEMIPSLTGNQVSVLTDAIERNSQVRDAFSVPARISTVLRRHGYDLTRTIASSESSA